MPRRTVGTRELKTRLGRYIEQVRRGVTLVVTQRGEPVAELRPIDKPIDERSRLGALRTLGVVTRRSSARLAKFRPIRITGPGLSRAVIEGRSERL
jgi:prevent-host-death family protein